MSNQIKHLYEFGPFRLDPEKPRLMRNDEVVPVPPKALEALIVLAENSGKLLDRESLMQAVWSDTIVEDANLTVAISQIRRALSTDGEGVEYVETIPRVGYRFLPEVRRVHERVLPLKVERHRISRTVIEEEILPTEDKTRLFGISIFPRLWSVPGRRKALTIGTGLLLLTALGSTFYLKSVRPPSPPGSNQIRSIAVLPPTPLVEGTNNASLSLGIADALITRLSALQKLKVRPTSAVARYLDSHKDSLEVGRALGVDAVLEGSLQRVDGRVQVALRLVDTRSSHQIWNGRFDKTDAEVFDLQDSIAQQVVAALSLSLTDNEKLSLTKRQTLNPNAYNSYLMGNYFWSKRGHHTANSIEHFYKAIELDPTFAEAYVGLANVRATQAQWPEAEALCEKALQLNNTLPEAHATYGFIKMFRSWDWAAAERSLDHAIALNPNCSNARHWKGVYLSLRGRLGEARTEMHQALELDPLSLIVIADIGQLHYFSREYDEAIEYCRRALSFDSTFEIAHQYLALIYTSKGSEEEAFAETILSWPASAPRDFTKHRDIFERSGTKGLAEFEIKHALTSEADSVSPLRMARLYVGTGNPDQALKWLEKGLAKREFLLPFINVDPQFDSLRSDPRFQSIIARIGL